MKEKQNLANLHSNRDFLQNIRKFVMKMVELAEILAGKDFDAIETMFEVKDADEYKVNFDNISGIAR